eukprot:COSAG05_NODE_3049_length_2383_cov_2.662434_2_plen_138_part_00
MDFVIEVQKLPNFGVHSVQETGMMYNSTDAFEDDTTGADSVVHHENVIADQASQWHAPLQAIRMTSKKFDFDSASAARKSRFAHISVTRTDSRSRAQPHCVAVAEGMSWIFIFLDLAGCLFKVWARLLSLSMPRQVL